MFDYKLLFTLLALEREGSFEGAARALGITSSAVSQRIRHLEELIGAITVNRDNPAVPTEFGAVLCRHTEVVMMLEESVIAGNGEQFSSFQSKRRTLKIMVGDDSLSTWFMEVIQSESKKLDPYLFELEIVDQDTAFTQMRAGSALAAISGNKTAAQGFRSVHLGTLVYKATATRAFVDRHFADGVTLETLLATPALKYGSDDGLQMQWIEQIFKKSVFLDSHILPSSNAFVSACLKDVGWAMNPAMMVDHHIEAGDLVELIPGAVLNKPLYWHYSRVVAGPMQQITQLVVRAATRHLVQGAKRIS